MANKTVVLVCILASISIVSCKSKGSGLQDC